MAGEATARIDVTPIRAVAVDDVGDPCGVPVLFVHGTPDSRLGRHPDDGVASRAGVRLLAVDRPGIGLSDVDPAATVASVAADHLAVADHFDIERFAVLAWSAGALPAVALAAAAPGRVAAVGIAAGLVPIDAFADPEVRAAADPSRVGFVDLARELPPEQLAVEVDPFLVPDPVDTDLARELVLEAADARRRAELEAVPGAVDQLAAAMVEAVRTGRAGLRADLAAQATPLSRSGVDLAAVRAPVRLWYGEHDPVAPPAFGRWWAGRLATAQLEVLPGASHAFPLVHWSRLLVELAAELRSGPE
ncbi:MAG: alpha/beta hydrolase [Actinobacteria bacterium]|nr:alpha/beta hydrolase [Actinomycetota bacterium]